MKLLLSLPLTSITKKKVLNHNSENIYLLPVVTEGRARGANVPDARLGGATSHFLDSAPLALSWSAVLT